MQIAEATTVRDLMSEEVVTVSPDASVADLLRLLAREGIGGVPVVDRSIVVGVVSASDVIRMASREGEPMPAAEPSAGEAGAADEAERESGSSRRPVRCGTFP